LLTVSGIGVNAYTAAVFLCIIFLITTIIFGICLCRNCACCRKTLYTATKGRFGDSTGAAAKDINITLPFKIGGSSSDTVSDAGASAQGDGSHRSQEQDAMDETVEAPTRDELEAQEMSVTSPLAPSSSASSSSTSDSGVGKKNFDDHFP
jgi:hypothetical protein